MYSIVWGWVCVRVLVIDTTSLWTPQTSSGIVLQAELSHTGMNFFPLPSFAPNIQDPHRKESPLLLQLTQRLRKLEFLWRVCVSSEEPGITFYCHMERINWCLGSRGAGYDREIRRYSRLVEEHVTRMVESLWERKADDKQPNQRLQSGIRIRNQETLGRIGRRRD